MRAIVRPLPVVYACQGCPQFGQRARDTAAWLESEGVVEAVWLGAAAEPKPTSRFPVFALDGCRQGCARRWLERHGIGAEVSCVL
jgi:uncharacterized metal-binding protein